MLIRYLVFTSFLLFYSHGRADMAPVIPPPADPAAALKVPPGFEVEVYARNLALPGSEIYRSLRFMAFDKKGNLYISLGRKHKEVILLPKKDNQQEKTLCLLADGLNGPQGLAFSKGDLLIANQDSIVRLHQNGKICSTPHLEPIVTGLPGGEMHAQKTLKVGPDGFLYVTAGSSCNVCVEKDSRRGAILRFYPDGHPAGAKDLPPAVYATGLRNSEGFAWYPGTNTMYATDNGADNRSSTRGGSPSDDLPPDEINLIKEGANYGWPYCWGKQVPDPNFPPPQTDFCQGTKAPALLLTPHSAPLGITFYTGNNFPAEYKNHAFVALHGSWDRKRGHTGYKVIQIHFRKGRPVRATDFITGWLDPNHGAWGRPVDVIQGPDGALYVSDDRGGMIYRIYYHGK
jgi:glucose/arabinose dehydrogenase